MSIYSRYAIADESKLKDAAAKLEFFTKQISRIEMAKFWQSKRRKYSLVESAADVTG
jgi:hypothetical protein